jgi:hypothetical protein
MRVGVAAHYCPAFGEEKRELAARPVISEVSVFSGDGR